MVDLAFNILSGEARSIQWSIGGKIGLLSEL